MDDQTRNLNPHKPALIAMCFYGKQYAAQRGGSMDFWDRLPEGQKRLCRDLVKRLEGAPGE
jgi:hypothetical protein